MRRIAIVVAILITLFPAAPVSAQGGGCTLTVSPGVLFDPAQRNWLYFNNTGADVQLDSFNVSWTNSAVTLEHVYYSYTNATGWTRNDVYPSATNTYQYIISDTMKNTSSFEVQFTFSGDAGGVNFSYSCNSTVPTPTPTPTGTYTPPPTSTPVPSPTPTATMTPTSIHTGTVVAGTPEPSATMQPTMTPTETPNPVAAVYKGMAAIVPVWTPNPVSTPSISLAIPTIDVSQVSGIAISVYQLLEQWHVFSTLIIVLIAIAFLRWMYAFATRRSAPDPENYIDINDVFDADFSEVKSAWRKTRKRF